MTLGGEFAVDKEAELSVVDGIELQIALQNRACGRRYIKHCRTADVANRQINHGLQARISVGLHCPCVACAEARGTRSGSKLSCGHAVLGAA